MPITFNSQGGFLNGTISSSNGDLFITTSGSAGQISIGNLKLSGSVIEELDNSGIVRIKKTFESDGNIKQQKFDANGQIIETKTKNPSGIETIQSASATSNQIVFEQTTNRAKLVLSGSTEPLIAVIDAGGSAPYGSNIRAKSFLISSASGVMIQGLTSDGKYGFRNAPTLGSSSDTDFFIDSDGKVNFNKGIVTTQITSSIITSSIVQTEGSNIFGDTISDTHLFNGHITSSGNISSSGDVIADRFIVPLTGESAIVGLGESSGVLTLGVANNITTQIGKNSSSPLLVKGNITASGNISSSGDLLKTKFVQMTNSSSVIDTFNTGSFRSAKYTLQVTSASKYQVSEMLVLHNDGTALNTEYAQINSGTNLIDFSTDVNGSNTRLISSSSFISCSVRFDRTIIPT